jgi:PGAP1-like protein
VSDTHITQVTGGAHGLAATYLAMRGLADRFDTAGSELRDWAGLGARTMLDPGLAASAPISPVSFALAERAVLAATTGPDGVLVESFGWEADAVVVRAVVTTFDVCDDEVRSWFQPLTERAFALTEPELRAGPLALAYGGDGQAGVRPIDADVPYSGEQPANLTGLVGQLQHVAALSQGSDSALNGTIEIQTIHGPDGVRHIVYLPGTDDMTTLPWTQDDDVRDLPTDLLLMSGHGNSYQQGILDAMGEAGIGPHDPVLLVGHSMGGMEAAAILGHGSDYDVTHVVTAGSPTAQVPSFPAGTHVLSLEHRGDVVPLTDGAPNHESVEQATVSFADHGGASGVVGNHDYWHYLNGAAAADASSDPSVQEQLASLHDAGFLASGEGPRSTVTSQVFQIVRQP